MYNYRPNYGFSPYSTPPPNRKKKFDTKCNQNVCINEPAKSSDTAIFEILGLKIYFDDLLIICILLFLYQEGIKDKYLFIALVLLLLS